MPTEEINLLNIELEPQEPDSFDIDMNVDLPQEYSMTLRTVLPMGGGAINSISVNGVEVPIVEGNVDITVPTKTSQLTNDSGYVKSSDLATVATTGDYNDLQNKPDIPSLDGYATETYVSSSISDHNTSNSAHQDIRNSIYGIQELIPAQATTDNQLADKNFVNSSIATETATFRGTYNEVTDLGLTTAATHSDIATSLVNVISVADSNDYCFVQIPTADATPTEIESIERYKFSTDDAGWQYEYTLNNSGFTAAQWAAINSGITSGLVTQIGTNASDIISLQTSVSGKVSKTGDTMTGDLTMDGSAVIVKGTNYWFKLIQDTSTITISSSNNQGATWSPQLQMWNSQNQASLKGSVYVDGGTTEDNRLLPHSEIDNPVISTSVTLVGGITHLNELGSVDYATIALPSSPGTAEYNGSFTSATSGDITVSLPLTVWQGETNIVAGRTYSFSIQNGRGFIIQMN